MQLNWHVHEVALPCVLSGSFPRQAVIVLGFRALIASIYCFQSAQVTGFVCAVRPNVMLAEIELDNRLICRVPCRAADTEFGVGAGVWFVGPPQESILEFVREGVRAVVGIWLINGCLIDHMPFYQ